MCEWVCVHIVISQTLLLCLGAQATCTWNSSGPIRKAYKTKLWVIRSLEGENLGSRSQIPYVLCSWGRSVKRAWLAWGKLMCAWQVIFKLGKSQSAAVTAQNDTQHCTKLCSGQCLRQKFILHPCPQLFSIKECVCVGEGGWHTKITRKKLGWNSHGCVIIGFVLRLPYFWGSQKVVVSVLFCHLQIISPLVCTPWCLAFI